MKQTNTEFADSDFRITSGLIKEAEMLGEASIGEGSNDTTVPRGYEILAEFAREAGASDEFALVGSLNTAAGARSTGIDELIDSGLVTEDELGEVLAKKANFEWISGELEQAEPEEDEAYVDLKEVVPAQIAAGQQVFPLSLEEEVLTLVCYDPFAMEGRQIVSRSVPYAIQWKMGSRRRVREAISASYGVGAGTFEKILDARDGDLYESESDIANVIDEDESDEASVLKFVNNILREALAQKATDIHVEPQRETVRIRYRVDGHLLDVPIPQHIHKLESAVIARLKIMAHLDVSERRIPQDGRINMSYEGRSIDVRVATIPAIDGETVSLRLLNQGNYNLDKLEMEAGVRNEIEEILKLTNGVILVTGPTGSGKSTSLYSFLDKLNTPESRTVTIEDPVENKLPGIVQIAVRPEVGLTFAKGLRSILRADPNIVMVGEIRDTETAEIAIRASLTGHLVLSTLHTNSAIGAVSRLIDMGVEPFLVSASVRGVLAQRLVRRLCKHCKRPHSQWSDSMRSSLDIPDDITGTPFEAVGCSECRNTGYSGRLALYEICNISDKIQEIISSGGSEAEVKSTALAEGYEDMKIYGMRKAMKGDTTPEEVLSATQSAQG